MNKHEDDIRRGLRSRSKAQPRLANTKKRKQGWQPIETAPKDGRHIIGYIQPCMKTGGVVGVFWLKPYRRKFLDTTVSMGGEWRYCVHDQVVAEPIYWMPLPEVPTQ
jgi:hypothetical protein